MALHSTRGEPINLVRNTSVNMRLSALGNLCVPEFVRNGRPLNVRVGGPLTINVPDPCLNAGRSGLGLTVVLYPYLTEDLAEGTFPMRLGMVVRSFRASIFATTAVARPLRRRR